MMSKLIRGYPEYMHESIEMVAKTRDYRLKNLEKIYEEWLHKIIINHNLSDNFTETMIKEEHTKRKRKK